MLPEFPVCQFSDVHKIGQESEKRCKRGSRQTRSSTGRGYGKPAMLKREMRYEASVDSGYSEAFTANSLAEACRRAEAWVRRGHYAPGIKTVKAHIRGDDGSIDEIEVVLHGTVRF